MMLPNTICHKIDETSPFYTKGPKEIVRSKFELVVFLEGIVESTGNTVQTKTSYLPREILWGYRFENMVKYLQKIILYINLNSETFNTDYVTLNILLGNIQ